MVAFSVSTLNRHDRQRIRRQKQRQKRKIAKNYRTLLYKEQYDMNKTEYNERNSRTLSRTKNINKRNDSVPDRNRSPRKERIRTITEIDNQSWLQPFINDKKQPIIEIEIDNKQTQCTVDTGATRIMMTSELAKKLWGNNYVTRLQKYPNRPVSDAQGNKVTVEGFKMSKLQIGNHLTVDSYPVVVYKASHEELLLGYTFISDYGLNVYSLQGLGTNQQFEVVKKLLAGQVNNKLTCSPVQTEVIPPKSVRTIKATLQFPDSWDITDRTQAIGAPILSSSEDLEQSLDITQLMCPYLYDVISIDRTTNLLIDNTDGIEPLVLHKGEIIAHSELLHEEVSPEYVRRILKGSTYSIDEETQPGEYKLHDDETIGRYDYVDKINIKSEEPGTAQFCKDLLFNTENFWSKSTFDVGRFDRKARMTLKTTTPVWDKYRPINPRKEKEAQQIINQLEKHKLISRANSPFCAQPVWCWKKAKEKEGKEAVAGELDLAAPRALRLALDYRKINKVIASNCHFPNPSIRQILFKLKSAKYVSIMDLTNSYWHIELTDSTKPLLAFQTATAQFVWNRLPQGTSPSMSIMAEAVQDTIYSGGIAYCTTCYVDNIIVTSNSLEDHKKDLAKTIEVFQARGWKANPSKSHVFINTHCRLLGFHVDLQQQTIGPDPQKITAILDLPPPTNQKSARSLCGSINYYSDLIPNLAPLMTPLHEITKDNKFNWTPQCQENFEIIKKKLAKLPVIYMPDFNNAMHLFTDAAQGQYLGYHISQFKPSLKKFVPIAYGSHKFSASERIMSQAEAELFAIIYALIQESLLLGFSKVIIHTDCKSLTYLFRFVKICSKLSRWQLILASYDLQIYFEPSTSIGIQISDLLSRRPEKRMINRRPKQEEIDDLPNIQFQPGTIMTFHQAKEEITKQIYSLPLLNKEQLKRLIGTATVDETISPDQLECNVKIVRQLTQTNDKLEDYNKQDYQPPFVFTSDQMAYKSDLSPSGRLINFVLQEAPGLSLTALKLHQFQDSYFGPILKTFQTTNKPVKDFAVKDGILLKEIPNADLGITYVICVPKSLSMELIGKFHYSIFGSHPDLKKMMANLKRRFFIKNLKNECIQITKNCQICLVNKSFNVMRQPFGTKIKVTGPRQVYALDICTIDTGVKKIDTTLPSSFLIVTDVWCLFSLAIPVNADITCQNILEKFSLHVIQPYGIPKVGIVSDGAKNFSCQLSNVFTAVLGLQQFRISPYNAKSNPSERINRVILSGLRYAIQQHDLQPEVFKNLIHYIVLSWNTSVLSHLKFSPYQLFLSTPYEPAILTSFVTIQEASKNYGDFVSALIKTQHIVENLVNQRYKETRDKRYQKQAIKSKHHIYSPGMLVVIKNRVDQTQRAHKLRPRYSGPYKIVKEYQNNVEVIDWRPNRKAYFIHKYKNEAKYVPRFERYLISKDRIKPSSDFTFYYDENLSRQFYQNFWDLVRDVQPVTEVERVHQPSPVQPIPPPNPARPSSLIIPAKIGVKPLPLNNHSSHVVDSKLHSSTDHQEKHTDSEGYSSSSHGGDDQGNQEAPGVVSELNMEGAGLEPNLDITQTTISLSDMDEHFMEENSPINEGGPASGSHVTEQSHVLPLSPPPRQERYEAPPPSLSRRTYDPLHDHRDQSRYSPASNYKQGRDHSTGVMRNINVTPPVHERWIVTPPPRPSSHKYPTRSTVNSSALIAPEMERSVVTRRIRNTKQSTNSVTKGSRN